MEDLTWNEKLAAARLMAIKKWAWFRVALFSLIPIEAKGYGTMGVSHDGIMVVDPDFIVEHSVAEIAGCLVHEVSHILRAHFERSQAMGIKPHPNEDVYEKAVWNVAADCEINDDLVEACWSLPEGIALPKNFKFDDGLTAEEYYQLLRKEWDPQRDAMEQQIREALQKMAEQGQGQGDGNGEGEQESQGQGQGKGQGKNKGKGKGQGNGKTPSAPQVGAGWCGSASGGLPAAQEDKARKEAGGGRSPVETTMIRKQTAEAINQEAQKGRGNVPGDWMRWAETELSPPKVDWRTKLRRACRMYIARKAGAVDLAYHKPSRRQGGLGYGRGCAIMPSYFTPVPRVAILVDTSGSMGKEELKLAVEESNGVLQAASAEVTFAALDAEVQSFKKVQHVRELTELLKGGGGTDFCPGFEAIERLPKHEKPQVLVFITDGCGPAPENPPPDIHVIWVLVGSGRRIPWPAKNGDWNGQIDWGTMIEIDEDGEVKIQPKAA